LTDGVNADVVSSLQQVDVGKLALSGGV